jgi:hypothetical protein
MPIDRLSTTEQSGEPVVNAEELVSPIDGEEEELSLNSIEELRALITQATAKLTRRLEEIEDHLSVMRQGSPKEVEDAIAGLMELLESKGIDPKVLEGKGDKEKISASGSHIFPELQRQVLYLESQISRASSDMRGKLDERFGQVKDRHDALVKLYEKTSSDSQRYLNRHLFYLAALIILCVFICGAFVQNAVDRQGNYLRGQIHSLNAALELLRSAPPSNEIDPMQNSGTMPEAK